MKELHARTLNGADLRLESGAIESLAASLRGDLIRPSDASYEKSRSVFNAMIERHPALIAQCAGVEDVISCVNFAREHSLLVSIRGGGHNAGGLGVCDGGLVIDLSQMRSVSVNPDDRTVRVDGGCLWSDVDRATHEHGLAVPSGIISTTGVGGLTLGGGIGHLTRKYGLTIDNLLGAQVVLADGTLITASATENPDLFWALRGGGGNFGVVCSFLFRAHPVSNVIVGPTLWPMERARDVMRWYREFLPSAPEELNGFFAFLTVPPGPPFPEHLHLKKMCGVVWCYSGPQEKADEVFRPIREFGPPALYGIHPAPFPALQSAFDPIYPAGHQWYWRADFVNELSDEAIERHLEFAAQLPTWQSAMHLYPIDGAVHRVGPEDTAFSYRDVQWAKVIVGVDPDPANKESITAWAKNYWDALHPFSAGGAYVNFMMDEGQDRVKTTYRDNYPRLQAVKKRYDPENLFRVNQNIQPAL
ncbi:MAG TPA: FAD-binding oxidoreductase [Capsulimonadaceae bacterium]|nr:FAD-binding oxidoreductase [Capsulimonadaceae bacterium]